MCYVWIEFECDELCQSRSGGVGGILEVLLFNRFCGDHSSDSRYYNDIQAIDQASASMGSTVNYDVGSWRLGDDGSILRRGRMRFSSGDVYEGEWVNGKRHGKGMLTFAKGGSYLGDFEGNFFHGFGLLTIARSQHPLTKKWINGEKYDGEFKHGKKHGRGRGKAANGDVYDGKYQCDYYHGRGVCVYANGDVYDGQWVRGKWHGDGGLRRKDGSIYTGEWSSGFYHGFGKLQFGAGGKHGSYAGDFRFGLRHGKGVRVFGDGKRYEGDWKEDTMDGVGVLECDEFKYVGEFVNGKFDGHGVISWANGDSYEGVFARGEMEGDGRYAYGDGGRYEGQWTQSKKHGRGRRVYSNGDVYDGEWLSDLPHGKGSLEREMQLAGGSSAHYRYAGDFVEGQQSGRAKISYTFSPANVDILYEWKEEYEFPIGLGFWHCGRGASTYEGLVYRGAFHGEGDLVSPDGKKWCGLWLEGKLDGHATCVYLPLINEHINENDTLPVDVKQQLMMKLTGLYRIVKYDGEFVDNVRHGQGQLVFENGDSIRGRFEKGFATGTVAYHFITGRVRHAVYDKGQRVRWLTMNEEEELQARERVDADRQADVEDQRRTVLRALIA